MRPYHICLRDLQNQSSKEVSRCIWAQNSQEVSLDMSGDALRCVKGCPEVSEAKVSIKTVQIQVS